MYKLGGKPVRLYIPSDSICICLKCKSNLLSAANIYCTRTTTPEKRRAPETVHFSFCKNFSCEQISVILTVNFRWFFRKPGGKTLLGVPIYVSKKKNLRSRTDKSSLRTDRLLAPLLCDLPSFRRRGWFVSTWKFSFIPVYSVFLWRLAGDIRDINIVLKYSTTTYSSQTHEIRFSLTNAYTGSWSTIKYTSLFQTEEFLWDRQLL